MSLGRNRLPTQQQCYRLWYYQDINRFVDEEGHVIHNFAEVFDVWQLDEWKRTQSFNFIQDRQGDWCELCYAERMGAVYD